MRFLVLGSGGREHAICRALATDPRAEIFAVPGNPGTAQIGQNLPLQPEDAAGVVALAQSVRADVVVPGPEAPLFAGVGDALRAAGIPCCGPDRAAARIEQSKSFARSLATRLGIPGPAFAVVRTVAELTKALSCWRGPPVVKADGPCGGKGVFLPDSKSACRELGKRLLSGALGDAGRVLVLEERLHGVEASLFYACHGSDFVALPPARDYKRLLDGDHGPNTGGMGAVSPSPDLTPAVRTHVARRIVAPLLRELCALGTPFIGFLFVGLLLTPDGPRLLEFNVRLGDPEAQVILPRLRDGELSRLCVATARGQLPGPALRIRRDAVVAVVLSAPGYPDAPRTGAAIEIDPALTAPDRWLIHAGTRGTGSTLVTAGGRVAAVVARARTVPAARARAYAGVSLVRSQGLRHRRDIGDIGERPPAIAPIIRACSAKQTAERP